MRAAQLQARAVKRADILIAKPQHLAFVQWLPLAAVAAANKDRIIIIIVGGQSVGAIQESVVSGT